MNIPHQTKLEYFQCPRVRTFQMSISKTTVILSMSEINRNDWMMLKYIKNKKKTSTTSACIFSHKENNLHCSTVLGNYLCWSYHFSLRKKKISLYVHNTLSSIQWKKNNIPATVTQNSEMKMVAIISWKQDNMVHTIYWWL